MPQPSWIENPEAWNTVVLGPATLPGICTETSRKGREVDFKKAPGFDGGTDTDRGSTPAEVTIEVQLTARDWPVWQVVLPQIDPNRAGAASSPLEIVHPEPNARGIRAVRVLDIVGNPPTARGGKGYTITCREWFPAAKPAKPQAKKSAAAFDPRAQPGRLGAVLRARAEAEVATPDSVENTMNNVFG